MKRLMKFVALMGALSVFYPIILLFRDLAFRTDGGILAFMLFLLVGLAGFAAGSVAVRIHGNSTPRAKVAVPVAYIAFLIPAVLGFLIYQDWGIEIPALSITYFIGLRAGIYDYRETLSNNKIYTGIVFLSSCILVVSLVDRFQEHLKPIFFICAFMFIMVSFIIQNQSNLDAAFTRRVTDLPDVPRNIRIYNIMMVFVLFIAIFILFNFQSIVVFLINVIKKAALYIILAVMWLMEKLTPPLEAEPGEGLGTQPLIPPSAEEQGDSIISKIIVIVLFVLIVSFLLYKIVPVIIRKMKKLVLTVFDLLKRFFKAPLAGEADENEDYYDETVIIKPDETKAKKALKRRKKRDLERELRRLKNPAEKVRLIYGYLLEILANGGVCLKKSDTAREICIKVLEDREALSKIDSIYGPFDKVTAVYEKVRYGNEVPDLNEITGFKRK